MATYQVEGLSSPQPAPKTAQNLIPSYLPQLQAGHPYRLIIPTPTDHRKTKPPVPARQQSVIASFQSSGLTILQVAAHLVISERLLSGGLRGKETMSKLRLKRLERFFSSIQPAGAAHAEAGNQKAP